MKKGINTLYKHPLVTSGSLLLAGTLFAYSMHFLFTIIMGRLLSVENFGLFSSLISAISFFAMIQLATGNLFSRFSAQFHAIESTFMQKKLLKKGLFVASLISVIALIFLYVMNSLILSLFKTENFLPIFVTELAIIATIFLAVPYGVLQGMLRFKFVTMLNVTTAVIKIAIGIVLVVIGLGVTGALTGVLFSILIPFLMALTFLMLLFRRRAGEDTDKKSHSHINYKKFSLEFVTATAAITLLSHGDIVFARIFLTPLESGQYAALSLMGKTIYYATQPIHTVFFPLVSYQSAKSDNITHTLKIAFFTVASISVVASIFYFLIPGFVQTIFFPNTSYEILRPMLGPFAIYITILSLVYVFHNFFLSLGKSAVYKINLIGAFVFVVLGALFHESIESIIFVLTSTSFVMLLCYIYYFITVKNERKNS